MLKNMKTENLELAKIIIKIRDINNHKNINLEHLIELLPRQTYNCEPFGLMLMQTKGTHSKAWTCCYYSHYSNKSDNRIPVIKANSIRMSAFKMLKWFVKNMPESL